MPNDKIFYLIFFVISISIVSVVAHMKDSKSLTSTEHEIQNTEDTSQIDSENETGIISFMLGNHDDDTTNDGA